MVFGVTESSATYEGGGREHILNLNHKQQSTGAKIKQSQINDSVCTTHFDKIFSIAALGIAVCDAFKRLFGVHLQRRTEAPALHSVPNHVMRYCARET